jgi:proteic killer suppression protein
MHGIFRDKRTAAFARGERVAAFAGFERTAERRLRVVMSATSLNDLRAMPGWRLEALRGDRAGQWSIRINDQWRICFAWSDDANHAVDIEIADYH